MARHDCRRLEERENNEEKSIRHPALLGRLRGPTAHQHWHPKLGIAPLEASLEQVQRVLLELDEANIVDEQENYLYAEFTSSLMGYVDDVEFMSDAASGMTHVRSASRLGYSDLGANRKRIEAIRAAIE